MKDSFDRDVEFKGRRFRPGFLPSPHVEKENKNEFKVNFPLRVKVTGVTKGPVVCESCTKVYEVPIETCSSCGSSFLSSERQMYLKQAINLGLGICRLEREPSNPYNSNAVKVYLRFPSPEGEPIERHVGYIPDAGEVNSTLISELLQRTTLLCKGSIAGGGDHYYGMTLSIEPPPSA